MRTTSEAPARSAQEGDELIVARLQAGRLKWVGFVTQQSPKVEVMLPPGTRLIFPRPATKAGLRGLIQRVLGGGLGTFAIFLPCRDYIHPTRHQDPNDKPPLPQLMRILDFGPHGQCPVRKLLPGLACTVYALAQAPQPKLSERK